MSAASNSEASGNSMKLVKKFNEFIKKTDYKFVKVGNKEKKKLRKKINKELGEIPEDKNIFRTYQVLEDLSSHRLSQMYYRFNEEKKWFKKLFSNFKEMKRISEEKSVMEDKTFLTKYPSLFQLFCYNFVDEDFYDKILVNFPDYDYEEEVLEKIKKVSEKTGSEELLFNRLKYCYEHFKLNEFPKLGRINMTIGKVEDSFKSGKTKVANTRYMITNSKFYYRQIILFYNHHDFYLILKKWLESIMDSYDIKAINEFIKADYFNFSKYYRENNKFLRDFKKILSRIMYGFIDKGGSDFPEKEFIMNNLDNDINEIFGIEKMVDDIVDLKKYLFENYSEHLTSLEKNKYKSFKKKVQDLLSNIPENILEIISNIKKLLNLKKKSPEEYAEKIASILNINLYEQIMRTKLKDLEDEKDLKKIIDELNSFDINDFYKKLSNENKTYFKSLVKLRLDKENEEYENNYLVSGFAKLVLFGRLRTGFYENFLLFKDLKKKNIDEWINVWSYFYKEYLKEKFKRAYEKKVESKDLVEKNKKMLKKRIEEYLTLSEEHTLKGRMLILLRVLKQFFYNTNIDLHEGKIWKEILKNEDLDGLKKIYEYYEKMMNLGKDGKEKYFKKIKENKEKIEYTLNQLLK